MDENHEKIVSQVALVTRERIKWDKSTSDSRFSCFINKGLRPKLFSILGDTTADKHWQARLKKGCTLLTAMHSLTDDEPVSKSFSHTRKNMQQPMCSVFADRGITTNQSLSFQPLYYAAFSAAPSFDASSEEFELELYFPSRGKGNSTYLLCHEAVA